MRIPLQKLSIVFIWFLGVNICEVFGEMDCSSGGPWVLPTKCIAPFKVIAENKTLALGFATNMTGLKHICSKLLEGLQCIEDYKKDCLSDDAAYFFNTMYGGYTRLIQDICREGAFQSAFLEHAPCISTVEQEYKQCKDTYEDKMKNPGDYQETEDEILRPICCGHVAYFTCIETVSDRACGSEAATFTKEVLDRIPSPFAKGQLCQDYQTALCPGAGHEVANSTDRNIFVVFVILDFISLLVY